MSDWLCPWPSSPFADSALFEGHGLWGRIREMRGGSVATQEASLVRAGGTGLPVQAGSLDL